MAFLPNIMTCCIVDHIDASFNSGRQGIDQVCATALAAHPAKGHHQVGTGAAL
jgi:hypothetical protein